ncbi:endonuclease [Mycobacterium neglectum]|uniref:endonuclease n=1 Tax=Mycobacterium neglectum TaxID=242737 RepID=UPI000BFEC3BE|nr:endonuclease [Mycobacterium neglectum]
MPTASTKKLLKGLLERAGTTYAQQAGIRLQDKPMPLFQLLVLCMLASKPIDAAIATDAAREVFKAGLRTPKAVLQADRSTMITAFGRAHYVRYDESSATRLVDIARTVHDQYADDLRGLADASEHNPTAARRLLKQFKGIGDTGADIFLREIQDHWTWARPFFDDRTLAVAKQLGLAGSAVELGDLAPRSAAKLAAALVRVSLDTDLRDELLKAT